MSLRAARLDHAPYPVAQGWFYSSSPHSGGDAWKMLWALTAKLQRPRIWGCTWHLWGVAKLCPALEADSLIVKPKMFAGFLCAVLVFARPSARARESSLSIFPFGFAVVSLSGRQRLCWQRPGAALLEKNQRDDSSTGTSLRCGGRGSPGCGTVPLGRGRLFAKAAAGSVFGIGQV